MFTVGTDRDSILPQYPCGARGARVSASAHGENWAIWKLVDDLEKHVGAPKNAHQKPKCKACYEKLYLGHEDGIRDFTHEMAEALKHSVDRLKKAFNDMAASINIHIPAIDDLNLSNEDKIDAYIVSPAFLEFAEAQNNKYDIEFKD